MADGRPFARPEGVGAAAPYERAPSPPYIHVPSGMMDGKHGTFSITPTHLSLDPAHLSRRDLDIITQGHAQIARDGTQHWRYESRRHAQQILDFLYLGPSAAAKDREFLAREGITLLLAARDKMMTGTRLLTVEHVAETMGIATAAINVASKSELIAAFPAAVRTINDHLLGVYRSQLVEVAAPPPPPGQDHAMLDHAAPPAMGVNTASFRRGKVLVFCETGNDRSATIVAGYIMAHYGLGLAGAAQFICMQRFCVSFDEETKFMLRAWEDLMRARFDVNRAREDVVAQAQTQTQTGGLERSRPAQAVGIPPSTSGGTLSGKSKRGFADVMQGDEAECMSDQNGMGMVWDSERLAGRKFSPFMQGDDDTMNT